MLVANNGAAAHAAAVIIVPILGRSRAGQVLRPSRLREAHAGYDIMLPKMLAAPGRTDGLCSTCCLGADGAQGSFWRSFRPLSAGMVLGASGIAVAHAESGVHRLEAGCKVGLERCFFCRNCRHAPE